jgi:hypothetical protein
MFFRSELNAVAKAVVISTLPTNNSNSTANRAEKPKNSFSVPGLMSYIAIVLFATLVACIIAHSGDDASTQKATDLDQPVVTTQSA